MLTNDQHNTRTSRCIGCHVGTPDGNYVSCVDAWPWPSVFANVEADATLHGQVLRGYGGCTAAGGDLVRQRDAPPPSSSTPGGRADDLLGRCT